MKKKRIIALVLCSMFVFSMVASANGTTMTEDMADNILRNNGFTDYMLENIMPDDKIELALTAQTPGTTVEPFIEVTGASSNNGLARDIIPLSELTLTVIGGKISQNSVLKYINCYVTSEWIDYPTQTEKDVVGISWGGDHAFYLDQDSFTATDYYKNQITGQWVSYNSRSGEELMSHAIGGYLAYNWDLRADLCKTYATFVLEATPTLTPNGIMQICLNYGHKTWEVDSVNISVTPPLASGQPVVFTASANYVSKIDNRTTTTTVRY